jgi:Spy/CpxP family protein refolding chaperone
MRSVVVTVLVAFLAGLSGVWVGKAMFSPAAHAPNLHEAVHRDLNLSAEQRQRIDLLERDFATRRQALELDMRAANADLAAAIREEHGYGPHVTAAVERFHRAMGLLQSDTIQHVFAMRAVLTPQQTARFDNVVASALTAEPQ